MEETFSSGKEGWEQSGLGRVHRNEEERNPWEQDIETPGIIPAPLRGERGGGDQ